MLFRVVGGDLVKFGRLRVVCRDHLECAVAAKLPKPRPVSSQDTTRLLFSCEKRSVVSFRGA